MTDASRARRPLPELGWGSLSRRAFLKSLFIAAGAAGAGVSLPACAPEAGRDPQGRPYLFFEPGEAALLQVLGDAVIPTQKGFPTLAEAEVIRRVDEELYLVGEAIRDDVRAALGLLQWAPVLFGGGPQSAAQLGKALGLHPRGTYDFFDALVALKSLDRDGDGQEGKYRNTPQTAAFLNKKSPAYIGGMPKMLNSRLFGFWNHLGTALKTGQHKTRRNMAVSRYLRSFTRTRIRWVSFSMP